MIKSRVEKISSSLKSNEAVLISSESNRRYLTGFPSSAGIVVITAEKGTFLIDFRYIEKAQATITSCDVVLMTKQYEQIKSILEENGINKVYIETERLDVATARTYREKFAGVEISEEPVIDKLLTDMRAQKTEEELKYICAAQEITDKAFSYICEYIKPGLTEKEVALEMEFFMRKLGSEGVSFDFIVVSGANSSLPHGVPTDKKIENGDFITMDFGAVVNGYRSDMTRTVAVGSVTDEQKKVYDTVLRAQLAGIDAIHEGVTGKEADSAARDIIEEAGYGDYFGHSLGHSVGIEIHEEPRCSQTCNEALKAGTVMTVEPGIYLPGKFGVRIEDMVYVTADGCRKLTHSPKELIIL